MKVIWTIVIFIMFLIVYLLANEIIEPFNTFRHHPANGVIDGGIYTWRDSEYGTNVLPDGRYFCDIYLKNRPDVYKYIQEVTSLPDAYMNCMEPRISSIAWQHWNHYHRDDYPDYGGGRWFPKEYTPNGYQKLKYTKKGYDKYRQDYDENGGLCNAWHFQKWYEPGNTLGDHEFTPWSSKTNYGVFLNNGFTGKWNNYCRIPDADIGRQNAETHNWRCLDRFPKKRWKKGGKWKENWEEMHKCKVNDPVSIDRWNRREDAREQLYNAIQEEMDRNYSRYNVFLLQVERYRSQIETQLKRMDGATLTEEQRKLFNEEKQVPLENLFVRDGMKLTIKQPVMIVHGASYIAYPFLPEIIDINTVSVDKEGRTCQQWASKSPHKHDVNHEDKFWGQFLNRGHHGKNHNYCRSVWDTSLFKDNGDNIMGDRCFAIDGPHDSRCDVNGDAHKNNLKERVETAEQEYEIAIEQMERNWLVEYERLKEVEEEKLRQQEREERRVEEKKKALEYNHNKRRNDIFNLRDLDERRHKQPTAYENVPQWKAGEIININGKYFAGEKDNEGRYGRYKEEGILDKIVNINSKTMRQKKDNEKCEHSYECANEECRQTNYSTNEYKCIDLPSCLNPENGIIGVGDCNEKHPNIIITEEESKYEACNSYCNTQPECNTMANKCESKVDGYKCECQFQKIPDGDEVPHLDESAFQSWEAYLKGEIITIDGRYGAGDRRRYQSQDGRLPIPIIYNCQDYIDNYPDLRNNFGEKCTNMKTKNDAYTHWTQYGKNENLIPMGLNELENKCEEKCMKQPECVDLGNVCMTVYDEKGCKCLFQNQEAYEEQKEELEERRLGFEFPDKYYQGQQVDINGGFNYGEVGRYF